MTKKTMFAWMCPDEFGIMQFIAHKVGDSWMPFVLTSKERCVKLRPIVEMICRSEGKNASLIEFAPVATLDEVRGVH